MSVITDCPYICAPNIMDTPDYQTKMVTLDMTGQTVIKAGTPISAEGKVANDETAIGILLNDCHACLGAHRGLVVISGRVKQDVAAEHSGITISDEAKSAMINLTFTGDGARGGGGGVKTVNGSEPDKNGNVEVNAGTQSDWSQKDTTALDYIKNRTHYYEEPTVIASTTAISANVFGNTMYKASDLKPTATELTGAKVTANGTEYTLTSDTITDCGTFYYVTYLPNPSYVSYGYVSICVAKYAGSGYATISGSSYQYSFPSAGIYFFQNVTRLEYGGALKRLDEKYMPESISNPVFTGSFSQNRKRDSTVGYYSHAEGSQTTASGDYSHAEGSRTTASGDYSHAEGSQTTASGEYSHVEGSKTEANGAYSHAEGRQSKTTADATYAHAEGYASVASGESSHAEGGSTTASGKCSHSEGQNGTLASGESSHAEGESTTAGGKGSHSEGKGSSASGNYSHAEGFDTTASGNTSHAEGWSTEATGSFSHAEGQYTKAAGDYQHVQGKYNAVESGNLSTLAHIVGNGTSDTTRSNAHTLDWSGNAWFAGTVEATALILKSSTVDSTKRFRITVDDSGTLSATEVTE